MGWTANREWTEVKKHIFRKIPKGRSFKSIWMDSDGAEMSQIHAARHSALHYEF